MIFDMTHRKLDPNTVARLTEESLRTPPVAAARMLEGHMNVDWCDMLPTIDVPVLIGAGDHDPQAPAAAADAAAALIPRTTVMRFAHSGHCPSSRSRRNSTGLSRRSFTLSAEPRRDGWRHAGVEVHAAKRAGLDFDTSPRSAVARYLPTVPGGLVDSRKSNRNGSISLARSAFSLAIRSWRVRQDTAAISSTDCLTALM